MRGLVWRRSRVIPAERVQYLEVVSARSVEGRYLMPGILDGAWAILVRAGDDSLWFGTGVPADELHWMKASIEVVLNA